MEFALQRVEQPAPRPQLLFKDKEGKNGSREVWTVIWRVNQGRHWRPWEGVGISFKRQWEGFVQMTEERKWLTFQEDDSVDWALEPGKAWTSNFEGSFDNSLGKGWELLGPGWQWGKRVADTVMIFFYFVYSWNPNCYFTSSGNCAVFPQLYSING